MSMFEVGTTPKDALSQPVVAYIGLGANLGDREATLRSAVSGIGGLVGSRVLVVSSWLQTEPVGPIDQPAFLNGAVALETTLSPERLMAELLRIELQHGRDRTSGQRWGPRTLDLDLLLYGTQTVSTDRLTIPHPRLTEREFVLVPLTEIAPHAEIPGMDLTVSGALDRLLAGRTKGSET